MFLRNVTIYLQIHTALQPMILTSTPAVSLNMGLGRLFTEHNAGFNPAPLPREVSLTLYPSPIIGFANELATCLPVEPYWLSV